jgi:hypothetical protein
MACHLSRLDTLRASLSGLNITRHLVTLPIESRSGNAETETLIGVAPRTLARLLRISLKLGFTGLLAGYILQL